MTPKHDKEPLRIVSLSDFLFLCRKYKRAIIKGALVGVSLAVLYTLTRPIEYKVQSSFKERATGGTSWSGKNSISSLLLGSGGTNSDQAVLSVLKSRNLMEKLVKACDLQASLEKRETKIFPLSLIRDHLRLQLAQLRSAPLPILQKADREVHVTNITYSGEMPLALRIVFHKDDSFQLETSSGTTQGHLGQPFFVDGARFELVRSGVSPLDNVEYTLSIIPMHLAVNNLSKKLTIKEDLDDSTLIRLQYLTRDRQQGARVLNTFMRLYQDYLKEQHQHLLNEQLAYLHSRQDDMQQHTAAMMKNYADGLATEMTHSGFPTANDAMAFLARMQQDYTLKLISIDLDLKGLRGAQQQGTMCIPRCLPEQEALAIKELHQKINQLRQQADSMALALHEGDRENLSSRVNLDEFQGLDLDLAKRLYVDYCKEKDTRCSQLLQTEHVMQQMQDPAFEMSSLSTLLTDPVSQKMIASASSFALELQDSDNRSSKEQERLRHQISVQKGFLSLHLNQTQQVLELQKQQLSDKIFSLQQVVLNLIQKEISILQQHLADHLQAGITSLEHEQSIIQQHQREQQIEVAQLPRKWVAEKLIEQEMNINKLMLEELGRLVESKNTLSQLEVVQSTPLDDATASIPPESRNILILAGLGGVTGALLVVSTIILQALMSGLPVTIDTLRLARLEAAGALSASYRGSSAKTSKIIRDQDLSVLRRLVTLLETGRVSPLTKGSTVLLFTGHGPDYSRDLASLFAKKGQKALLLSLNFDHVTVQEDQPGLLQYLQGEADWPNIRQCEEYDVIASGGIARFAHELMGTLLFDQFLAKLSSQYDWVFAMTACAPNSAEGEALLRCFAQSVITITDQKWPDLAPVITTAHQSTPNKNLIFIFA